MALLAHIIAWINAATNGLGKFLLAPVGMMPGWLSNTIVSAIAGVVLLAIFKYTSNQRAIGRARDDIKANMLALRLFKESLSVALLAQGRTFRSALLLLVHAIRPMLVMILPVTLLLAQLGLWYQQRPLRAGQYAVVTMKLNGPIDSPWPEARISSMPAADVTVGPVRILSKREICWEIRARENGSRPIVFQVGGRRIEKELTIGDGFMRVSAERPAWQWADILQHPAEKPFEPDSAVRSVSISYPGRSSWTSGTNWWVLYFFGASVVFALIFKPFLRVRM